MEPASYARKYGLVFYWLGFAVYTLYMAQFPGLIARSTQWSYPWAAVFVVWALLAVLVGLLHLILRPRTYHHSWGRLMAALSFSTVLLILGAVSVVTDMPGYYYVPAMFSVVTMAAMLLFVIAQAAVSLRRKRSHA